MRCTLLRGGVHLHVRKCAPLFRISENISPYLSFPYSPHFSGVSVRLHQCPTLCNIRFLQNIDLIHNLGGVGWGEVRSLHLEVFRGGDRRENWEAGEIRDSGMS